MTEFISHPIPAYEWGYEQDDNHRSLPMKRGLVHTCHDCLIYRRGEYNPVNPICNRDWDMVEHVDLFVVGEAPGEEEAEALIPFVGRSGKLLRGVLNMYESTYCIGNTVSCRPTTEDEHNRTPINIEIFTCSKFVRRVIAKIKPKAILVLGMTAVKGFMEPRTALEALRVRSKDGAYQYKKIPLFVSYHPSYILRTGGVNGTKGGVFMGDISHIMRLLRCKRVRNA